MNVNMGISGCSGMTACMELGTPMQQFLGHLRVAFDLFILPCILILAIVIITVCFIKKKRKNKAKNEAQGEINGEISIK